MRKLLLLIAIAGGSALFGGGSATAQNIEGRWLNTGYAEGGSGTYATTVVFDGNGGFFRETALRGGRGAPMGDGLIRCEGGYEFDGQYLATQVDCVVCAVNGACTPMPAQPFGGPVLFQDPYTFSIGGDIFRRQ